MTELEALKERVQILEHRSRRLTSVGIELLLGETNEEGQVQQFLEERE
jgi:hypothetical protein